MALLLGLIVLFLKVAGSATQQMRLLRIQGEVFDLKGFVRKNLNCEETLNTCPSNNQPLKLNDCKEVSDYNSRYQVRSSCQMVDDKPEITVEYLLKKRSDPTQVALHPITKKPYQWQKLFSTDLKCTNSLVLRPHAARNLVKHTFQPNLPYHSRWSHTSNSSNGGAAAFVTEQATMEAVCNILGYKTFVSVTGAETFSSCGDNQSLKWNGTDFSINPACGAGRLLIRSAKLTCQKVGVKKC